MSRSVVITFVAGLLLPLLWTLLEAFLFSLLLTAPVPTWHFSALQVLVGAASGAILVVPLALMLRPNPLLYGGVFVTAFLLSFLAFTWLFGGGESITALGLIDVWAFVVVALGSFWWAARRNVPANAA
jgi:hypothetical protein